MTQEETTTIDQQVEPRPTTELDGVLYYEDTGEFAGFVPGVFVPDELKEAGDIEKYLEKLLNEEASLLAEQTRLDSLIAALKANYQPTINAQARRVQWLRARFDKQAETLAFTLLPKKADGTFKSKTWSCPFGKVSFTTKGESITLADPVKAMDYAEQNGYDDCVKVEKSFLISNLPKEAAKDIMEDPEFASKNGFEFHPATENCKVNTGVTSGLKGK